MFILVVYSTADMISVCFYKLKKELELFSVVFLQNVRDATRGACFEPETFL